MNDNQNKNNTLAFGALKHREDGMEYWSARELQKALGYASWQKFENVIKGAKRSFKNSKISTYYDINDHFNQVVKMISTGKGAEREVKDYMLSRYACYLIAQNGDPTKRPIALAQAYFNVQTMRQEEDDRATKDRIRLDRRNDFSESDKRLSGTIAEMGITSHGIATIKDSGNKVFFGGNSSKDMAKKLGTGRNDGRRVL